MKFGVLRKMAFGWMNKGLYQFYNVVNCLLTNRKRMPGSWTADPGVRSNVLGNREMPDQLLSGVGRGAAIDAFILE